MIKVTFFAGKSQAYIVAVRIAAEGKNKLWFRMPDDTMKSIRRADLISIEQI